MGYKPMIVFYLDTSAFVKRYRTEKGTEVMDQIFALLDLDASKKASTSMLGVLEFVSACSRLQKNQEIEADDFNNLFAQFLEDLEKYYLIRPLNDQVVVAGIKEIIEHRLKSADSLHLATALRLERILGDENLVVFVTADEELFKAAREEGIETINPCRKGVSKKIQNLSDRNP